MFKDAERTIARANPPLSKQESMRQNRIIGLEKKSVDGISDPIYGDETSEPQKAPVVSKNLLKGIRAAHVHITDEEFEARKSEAIEKGEPLTRTSLIDLGREKRRAEKQEERESQLAEEKAQFEIMFEEDPNRFLHIRLDEGLVNWHNVLAHTGGPGKGNDLGKMTIAEVRQLQKDFQRVMHPDKNSWYAERTHQEQLNWIALRGVIEAVLESLERQITINVTGGKHEKL